MNLIYRGLSSNLIICSICNCKIWKLLFFLCGPLLDTRCSWSTCETISFVIVSSSILLRFDSTFLLQSIFQHTSYLEVAFLLFAITLSYPSTELSHRAGTFRLIAWNFMHRNRFLLARFCRSLWTSFQMGRPGRYLTGLAIYRVNANRPDRYRWMRLHAYLWTSSKWTRSAGKRTFFNNL